MFKGIACGPCIAVGKSREVYYCKLDDSKVIKVARETEGNFPHITQNLLEWHLWNTYKDTSIAKFLAPCHDITNCGSILVQDRTTQCSQQELDQFLSRVRLPAFLHDLTRYNCGWLRGSLVVHDYGYPKFDDRLEKK